MPKACRIIVFIAFFGSMPLSLSACAKTCRDPNICKEIAPAYTQMTDEQIQTMTTDLNRN